MKLTQNLEYRIFHYHIFFSFWGKCTSFLIKYNVFFFGIYASVQVRKSDKQARQEGYTSRQAEELEGWTGGKRDATERTEGRQAEGQEERNW